MPARKLKPPVRRACPKLDTLWAPQGDVELMAQKTTSSRRGDLNRSAIKVASR